MALNAYLKLTGQKQGDIKGSVTQKGREDSIMVIAVSHEIVSPRDSASGLPTGKRMHKPLVITKELDKASPLLYNVLCNNENITKFELKFWAPQTKAGAGVGTEVQRYTIKLTNANIASIDFRMLNNKNPDLMKYAEYEEIAFTYQKIEWTWMDGGITADDDWESPVV
jgi:type VI secretion system secreted protein Hcp